MAEKMSDFDKGKKKDRDEFVNELNEKFEKHLIAYQFKAEREKKLRKLLATITHVLDLHDNYTHEKWGPSVNGDGTENLAECMIRLGLKRYDLRSICTTTQIVEWIIDPAFSMQNFIKHLIQYKLAEVEPYISYDNKIRSQATEYVTFVNGTGYVTDRELRQARIDYERCAGI